MASEKDLPIRSRLCLEAASIAPHRELGTAFAQVVQQRGRDLVSQGQPKHAASLALPDAEASGSPLHVIQREAHDLAGSQPTRGDQEKDRIVAKAARRRAINARRNA